MVRWEFDWLLQGHKDDVKTLIIFLCLIHFQFLDWPCLWTQKPLGKKLLEIVDPRLYYIIIFDFFCVYYSLVICNVFTLLTQIFLYMRLIYFFSRPRTALRFIFCSIPNKGFLILLEYTLNPPAIQWFEKF